jgi:hypothetical protein
MRIYVSWLADFYEEGVVVTSPVQLKVLCQCLWAFAELDDILESREVSLLFHLYIYIYICGFSICPSSPRRDPH